MLYPYLLIVLLYLSLTVLVALDASLASFTLIPFFSGLRWLRVHLIALGTLTEVSFGLLPLLVALRAGRPRPPMASPAVRSPGRARSGRSSG